MAYTFGASDLLTAMGFSLSDLEVQSGEIATTKQSARETGRKGDFLVENQYDERSERTIEASSASSGAPAKAPRSQSPSRPITPFR